MQRLLTYDPVKSAALLLVVMSLFLTAPNRLVRVGKQVSNVLYVILPARRYYIQSKERIRKVKVHPRDNS